MPPTVHRRTVIGGVAMTAGLALVGPFEQPAAAAPNQGPPPPQSDRELDQGGSTSRRTDGRGKRVGPGFVTAHVDGGLRSPPSAARAARGRRWVKIWSIAVAWVMHCPLA